MLETALEEVLKTDSYTKKVFLGVFARDELPQDLKYPCCFIINTAPRSKPGEHWLALYYNHKGYCDFFDSYGMHPTFFNLENYLNKSSTQWSFNKKRIQGLSAYCGHYSILFLLFRSRNKLIDFFKNFDLNYIKNDRKLKNLINEF